MTNHSSKFIAIAAVLLSIGCSKPKAPQAPDVVTPIRPSETRTCETAQNVDRQGQLHNESVTILRVYQRTIRRDCDYRITSDRFETVKEPKANMRFEPYRNSRGLKLKVLVSNRQTCDTTDGWTPAFKKNEQFITLHTSDVFIGDHLHVDRTTDNYLDYTFWACDPRRDGRKCEPNEIFEQGTVRLRINYSEQRIQEPREIQAQGCNRPRH